MKAKRKIEKRYILWAISLIIAVGVFVTIIRSAMVPMKYLLVVALFGLGIYAFLFFFQKKWSKGRFTVAAVIEVLLIVISVYGMSVLYHATHMVKEITEMVIETESISAYVLQEAPWVDLQEAVSEEFGVVKGQSEEAVGQVLQKLHDNTGVTIAVSEYEDMFVAVDALRADEVQVLLLNDAYAGLISEIEGYEWFTQEVRILASSVEEVQVEKTVISEVEDSTEDISQPETDIEVLEESQVDEKETGPAEEKPVKKELMEPPEHVDWNALVNQEMLVAPDGAFIMYISGVDTWGSVSIKSRSDVNILAVVNTNTKKVLLVSTPRDYYVPLSVSNGVKDKLTHAGIYGINTSVGTLEMLYGVDIQYYVRMNFTGFVNIVDALGGVDVYSDSTFKVGAYAFSQGVNHMSGNEALAFARERYSFAGGDRARGNHQMEVIKAVLNKCTSSSILYNYADVMNSVSGCFSTDMSKEKIASLVRMQLGDMAQWSISSVSVDGTGAHKTTYSIPGKTAYVMIPDEVSVQNAKNSIAAVLNGQ